MVTMAWKVYGADGHRQRVSFSESFRWDFSDGLDIREIEVDCFGKTGTHDYVIVRITRNTIAQCKAEMQGQLTDGIFEDSRYGRVELVEDSRTTYDDVLNALGDAAHEIYSDIHSEQGFKTEGEMLLNYPEYVRRLTALADAIRDFIISHGGII